MIKAVHLTPHRVINPFVTLPNVRFMTSAHESIITLGGSALVAVIGLAPIILRLSGACIYYLCYTAMAGPPRDDQGLQEPKSCVLPT